MSVSVKRTPKASIRHIQTLVSPHHAYALDMRICVCTMSYSHHDKQTHVNSQSVVLILGELHGCISVYSARLLSDVVCDMCVMCDVCVPVRGVCVICECV